MCVTPVLKRDNTRAGAMMPPSTVSASPESDFVSSTPLASPANNTGAESERLSINATLVMAAKLRLMEAGSPPDGTDVRSVTVPFWRPAASRSSRPL
jgi:hypothetical protein